MPMNEESGMVEADDILVKALDENISNIVKFYQKCL